MRIRSIFVTLLCIAVPVLAGESGSQAKEPVSAKEVVSAKETVSAKSVKSVRTATISGTIFYDLNENGLRDTGEPGKPEHAVKLFDADDSRLIATVFTDEFGRYAFELPGPGDYRVAHGGLVGTNVMIRGNRGIADLDGPIVLDRRPPEIRGLNILNPRLLNSQNFVRPNPPRLRSGDTARPGPPPRRSVSPFKP